MTWLQTTIGHVCLPTSQRDPSANGQGTFRYVDIAGIDRESKTISRAEIIHCFDAPSRARKVIQRGDVLVSTVRPNLNAVAQVPDELDDAIASTGFAVLRTRSDVVESRYLFFWAQHQEFINFLTASATGASYPAVSDGIVRRASLPLPPPSEQRRIVEILDEADRLRTLRREANATAANVLSALFLKIFGDPVTNPKNLRKEPLEKIIRVKSGEFLPAKEMTTGGQFPVYGGNGVSGYHDKYMFEQPKVVLGRVGAYCGVVHYTPPRAWITDNALYVSEKLIDLDDLYLVAALTLANLNQYAGRAGQPLISGSRIYPIQVLVPPESEQLAFARLVGTVQRLDSQRLQEGQKLNRLWDSLVQRAFSGQLTAKWRRAHMGELLEEMRQQAKFLNLPPPSIEALAAEA